MRTLFEKIGRELGVQANLLTSKQLANQHYYGWAYTLKGINWIFINYNLLAEHLKERGELNLQSVWVPVKTIDAAVFYTLVHEYTHLQDRPQSNTGLNDEDYFAALAPPGGAGHGNKNTSP